MSRFFWSGLWTGCGGGGCLLPLLGFVACGLLFNDVGGPLFWPIIGLLTGFLGGIVGAAVGAYRGSTQARSAAYFGDTDER